MWSKEKFFYFKCSDSYYKVWLSNDESFQVCKDRVLWWRNIWAEFVKDIIVGTYVMGKKDAFTSKKFYFFLIYSLYFDLQIYKNIRTYCIAIFHIISRASIFFNRIIPHRMFHVINLNGL